MSVELVRREGDVVIEAIDRRRIEFAAALAEEVLYAPQAAADNIYRVLLLHRMLDMEAPFEEEAAVFPTTADAVADEEVAVLRVKMDSVHPRIADIPDIGEDRIRELYVEGLLDSRGLYNELYIFFGDKGKVALFVEGLYKKVKADEELNRYRKAYIRAFFSTDVDQKNVQSSLLYNFHRRFQICIEEYLDQREITDFRQKLFFLAVLVDGLDSYKQQEY